MVRTSNAMHCRVKSELCLSVQPQSLCSAPKRASHPFQKNQVVLSAAYISSHLER